MDADLYGPTAAAADVLWMTFLRRAAHMVPGFWWPDSLQMVGRWCPTGGGSESAACDAQFFCFQKKIFTVSAGKVAQAIFGRRSVETQT